MELAVTSWSSSQINPADIAGIKFNTGMRKSAAPSANWFTFGRWDCGISEEIRYPAKYPGTAPSTNPTNIPQNHGIFDNSEKPIWPLRKVTHGVPNCPSS